MITGVIKSQIDQVWNAFWSGGISNPLEVIEQITYRMGQLRSANCSVIGAGDSPDAIAHVSVWRPNRARMMGAWTSS